MFDTRCTLTTKLQIWLTSTDFSAEIICAMWDVAWSCFVCLNGPQCMRVIEWAICCRSGRILRLDAALLTKLLYGDDTAQADCDELLRRFRKTAIGEYLLLTDSCLAPFSRFPQATSVMACCCVSDSSANNMARLTDSDSKDELGALLGMVRKYHSQA